jgi:hypothetical protein
MKANPTSPLSGPEPTVKDQFAAAFAQAAHWFQTHWLQIALATAAGVAIYLVLTSCAGGGYESASVATALPIGTASLAA